MTEAPRFARQTCGCEYKVARVEAKLSSGEGRLTCTSCGGPLNAREGGFALKYFRVGDGRPQYRVKARSFPAQVTQLIHSSGSIIARL
jgi:hypothetical protein